MPPAPPIPKQPTPWRAIGSFLIATRGPTTSKRAALYGLLIIGWYALALSVFDEFHGSSCWRLLANLTEFEWMLVQRMPWLESLFGFLTALIAHTALLLLTTAMAMACRPPALGELARNYWRCCYATTPLLIVLCALPLMPGRLDPYLHADQFLLTLALVMLIVPTLQLRAETARRCCRWRPECPECGFRIFRATSTRCTECGAPFLGPPNTRRRWAIRRFRWESTRSWFKPLEAASLATAIIFQPCRAAERLSLPDRFGPAAWWFCVGVVTAAIACAASSALDRVALQLTPAPDELAASMYDVAAPGHVARYLATSIPLWIFVMTSPVVIAAIIARCWPRWNASARAGAIKWALYATAIWACIAGFVRLLTSVLSLYELTPLSAVLPWTIRPSLAADVICFLIVFWWSLGAACGRFLPRRGPLLAIALATVFFALIPFWFLLVLPLGGLSRLL